MFSDVRRLLQTVTDCSCRYSLTHRALYVHLYVYLSSLCIFRGVVISTHAQNVLHAVEELREAIKLAVGVIDDGLVDAAQRRLSAIGAVKEGDKNLPTLVEVARSPQMELLSSRTDLILQV